METDAEAIYVYFGDHKLGWGVYSLRAEKGPKNQCMALLIGEKIQ